MITEPLRDDHDLNRFDSGKSALDQWLRQSASHAQRNRTCRTHVWHEGDGVVVAYFGLAGHLIERDDLGRIGRGSPDQIPAVLLARLALQKDLQGRGFGAFLLVDALRHALYAGSYVAARFVVADAIDEAAAGFYMRHGFVPMPTHLPRLVRKVSDIAHDLGM